MFNKLYKGNKSGKPTNGTTHSNRNSEGSPHRTGKQRDLILTNILEEGSTVDEPRSFEQDEQYLDECLKALDGNSEALQAVEAGDLEEYDFDDYNSIASTASLLNIHAELAQEHNNAVTRNHSPLTAIHNAAFQGSQPNGTVKKETVINGTDTSPSQLREQLLRMSKVQASISKVKNWSKFSSSGALSRDEWRDVFLEAAQEGDLKRVQETYRKLGGTSELAIRITDSLANTALHKAAEAGNLPCLQWLVGQLPNDCLSNITNHDNLTPLAVAVKNGSVQCVQWLLEDTSAEDEMSDDTSRFALIHLTIQNGQDDCLKCLLTYIKDKYLELDVTDSSGVTLAHVAAREGHLTCLQTLVDHNIDVTAEDKDGRSPTDYAYAAGQTGCARYLVMEESCRLLSMRVAKLHRELKECKDENKELRQKLEILESRARSGMPDRPEAVGGDQSDTNSTGATKSSDDRLGTKLTDSPCSDRSRASGSPDGESPKGFRHERSAYHYHINGSDHSFEHRPLLNRPSSNGITVVNKESEVKSARQFEALKQERRMGPRGSIDSTGSGLSSPMSWSDTTTDNSAMQQVMAQQIAANTRRLVMSKHAQKVEESPLIRTNLTPVVSDGVPVDEPRQKGSRLQVLQPDIYYSPSSSRSHSPARTDSTSGSRPTSATLREDFNNTNKMKISRGKEEKRTTGEDRAGTPSRLRSLANRRKTSFSSDSSLSSDSDVERSGQRSNGPRHRRGNPSSNRTKEHSGNKAVSRQSLHRQVSDEENRTKKTVSWNEALKANTPTNLHRQISDERPRISPTNENRQIPNERPRISPTNVHGQIPDDKPRISPTSVHRQIPDGRPRISSTDVNRQIPDKKLHIPPTNVHSQIPDERPRISPTSVHRHIPDERPRISPTSVHRQIPDERPRISSTDVNRQIPDKKLRIPPTNVHRQIPDERPPISSTDVNRQIPDERPRISPTNIQRQIPDERPRVPPKPPVRTVSRDSGVVRTMSRDSGSARTVSRDSDTLRTVSRDISPFEYVQVPRTPPANGLGKSIDNFVVSSVTVRQPVKPIAENVGTESSLYSFDGYQQDDRPWYETDEFY